ncbi:MAG: molybdopterin-synthase adenylyltransferase MoeB [Cyclobacteriaceae bacterium]
MTDFSRKELERYSRHLIIPEFNLQGQQKLKAARVLVVGCGGLGAPLLSYLAAAGVGTIGLLDYDVVDESNLQRQVLFSVNDVGRPKVEAAAERLHAQNPHIQLQTYQTKLTSANAIDIIQNYDIVADGTDNFPTRYLVNDACVLLGKVNIYASVYRFEGQLSVFNYVDSEGKRYPNYRDLFPAPPPPGQVPSCAEGGVLGVLPGIMGSLQANEVIKVITGLGEPLAGRLFIFDTLSFESRTLKIHPHPENPLTGKNPTQTQLIDYEQFCGLPSQEVSLSSKVKEIDVQQFRQMRENKEDYQLIDVREPYEYDIAHLGGELMPGKDIDQYVEKIHRDKKVVVHCRSGVRSSRVIEKLEKQYGFSNLYNLRGGLLAWAEEVDPAMPVY